MVEILLSIIITLGAAGAPTGGFNECPPAPDNDAVATVLSTTSPTFVQEA